MQPHQDRGPDNAASHLPRAEERKLLPTQHGQGGHGGRSAASDKVTRTPTSHATSRYVSSSPPLGEGLH